MQNAYRSGVKHAESILGMRPGTFSHVGELAGLGLLAAIPARHLYGKVTDSPIQDGDATDHVLDLTGLGLLAAPSALHLLKRR